MNNINIIPIEAAKSKLLDNFKKSIGELYTNGGLIIQQFEVDKTPNPKSDIERVQFINALLESDVLQKALPELTEIVAQSGKHYSSKWSVSAVVLQEEIAREINWAGAYTSINIREAERLAQDFIKWMDIKPDNLLYIALGHDWSRWFCNIVWDYSYLILDSKKKIATLICATDTD